MLLINDSKKEENKQLLVTNGLVLNNSVQEENSQTPDNELPTRGDDPKIQALFMECYIAYELDPPQFGERFVTTMYADH